MNIKEMHYDLKSKLNKLDSQQYRNLKVPEIDWKLNEAIELFVKVVAQPKYAKRLGFELSQRITDDIRTLVVHRKKLVKKEFIEGEVDFDPNPVYELPDNYFDYIGTYDMSIEKDGCTVTADHIMVRQHDDSFATSPFDKSSFLWKEVNIRFYEDGIKVYTEGDFDVVNFYIDYIKQPAVVNNSESYIGGSYKTLTGVTLNTNVDCDLPSTVHREIVDLAVAIITGDLQIPDLQIKKEKLAINQLP